MSRGMRGRLDRMERDLPRPRDKGSLLLVLAQAAVGTASEEDLVWLEEMRPALVVPERPDPLEETIRQLHEDPGPRAGTPAEGLDTDALQ